MTYEEFLLMLQTRKKLRAGSITELNLAEGSVSETKIAAGAGGAKNFVELGDVPSTYVGQAARYTKVKAGENGLEFGAKITISDSTPAGGTNGDIWLEY